MDILREVISRLSASFPPSAGWSPVEMASADGRSTSNLRVQFPVESLSPTGGSNDLRSPGSTSDYRSIIPRTPERRTVLLPVPETRRARTRSNDFSRTTSGASLARGQSFGHRTVNPSPLGPTARRRSVTHTTNRKAAKERDESHDQFDPSNYEFGIPGLGDDYFASKHNTCAAF